MQKVKMTLKKILDCCLFCGGLLAIVFMYASLNYSGFCFDEMRYLSDTEKIKMMFEMRNQYPILSLPVRKNGKIQDKRYKKVAYKSFEQFMESNPDCCTIDPGRGSDLPPPEFLDRITGYHSGEVIMGTYTVRYLDDNGNQKSKELEIVSVLQNCGRRKY